jgi:outer membrane protein
VEFGATSATISSQWGLNFNYSISAGALSALRSTKAQLDATDQDISSAAQNLKANVEQQYILALQLQERADLQDTLITSNQLQLDLARAKAGVGTATSLDVKRAEVAVGQVQVAALRAHNLADVAVLQLVQQIGIAMSATVRLTTQFQVSEPTVDVRQLIDMANHDNPVLKGLQYREQSADQTYKAERTLYVPTLSLGASLGGTTSKYADNNYLVNQAQGQTFAQQAACFQQDSLRRGAGLPSIAGQCSAIVFTNAQANALRSANDRFPFSFQPSPYNLSMTLSLPLFDGFIREKNIEDAATNRTDARYNIKAQQLKLVADITSAYTTLVADYRTVRLQEANVGAAREALQLAQERYRVGLNSLVDLQSARSDYETAESGRIDAVFEFHRAYSALENAVGRPIR